MGKSGRILDFPHASDNAADADSRAESYCCDMSHVAAMADPHLVRLDPSMEVARAAVKDHVTPSSCK